MSCQYERFFRCDYYIHGKNEWELSLFVANSSAYSDTLVALIAIWSHIRMWDGNFLQNCGPK